MTTATVVSPGQPAGASATRRDVVSYERLSKFKDPGSFGDVEVSVAEDRQAEDAMRAADALGLGAIDVHYRGDRSASEFRATERPAFEKLCGDIAADRVAVVFVWVMDRLFRDPEDQERFLKLCKRHGVRLIQSRTRRELDLDDPDDVTQARVQGAFAAGEVAKMSIRIRRAKDENAKRGLPHGGRRRFGYEPGMDATRGWEAVAIRELATRFLAGESLYKLAQWLNTPGPVGPGGPGTIGGGPQGGRWTGPNLRHLLGRPHLAGLRVHHGQVIGRAAWPAILPEETHHKIVAMLAKPERRTNGTGSNARRYLLAGLAVCDHGHGTTDECGAKLRGVPVTKRAKAPAYRCPTGRHVHRPLELVEAMVEAAMVERLSRYDANGILVDDEATAELARLMDARAAMEAEYADCEAMRALPADHPDRMTLRAYNTETKRLEEAMRTCDVDVAAASANVDQASRVLDGAIGEAAALAWYGPGGPDGDRSGGFSLARRRAIIAELAEVRLAGGKRGTHSFQPSDVVIDWR